MKQMLFSIKGDTLNRLMACAKDTISERAAGTSYLPMKKIRLFPGENQFYLKAIFSSAFSGVEMSVRADIEHENFSEPVFLGLLPMPAKPEETVEVYREDEALKVEYTDSKIVFTDHEDSGESDISKKVEQVFESAPTFQVRLKKQFLKDMIQRITRLQARGLSNCDSILFTFTGDNSPVLVSADTVSGIEDLHAFIMPMRLRPGERK